MNCADQCRAMGLVVGDTIEGSERSRGYFHEARLTLLWLGEQVAVWSVQSRSSMRARWSEPEEDADWTLDCREWHKLPRDGSAKKAPLSFSTIDG